MKKITINELELRLKATLAKNRCSLSVKDAELLEATLKALNDLKNLKNAIEKKKKVEEIATNLFRFYANLQILQKYQTAVEEIINDLE